MVQRVLCTSNIESTGLTYRVLAACQSQCARDLAGKAEAEGSSVTLSLPQRDMENPHQAFWLLVWFHFWIRHPYFNLYALFQFVSIVISELHTECRFAQMNSQELVAGALRTTLGRPQLCLTQARHSQGVTKTRPLSHPTHDHIATTPRETTCLERFPFLWSKRYN